MMHFEKTLEIAQDPRVVYTYLADLEHTLSAGDLLVAPSASCGVQVAAGQPRHPDWSATAPEVSPSPEAPRPQPNVKQ
jgi:hypothetical protein